MEMPTLVEILNSLLETAAPMAGGGEVEDLTDFQKLMFYVVRIYGRRVKASWIHEVGGHGFCYNTKRCTPIKRARKSLRIPPKIFLH